MTMIRFTYDDGENVTVATWSSEYGIMLAGSAAVMARITVEEIPSREMVDVPMIDLPMRTDIPRRPRVLVPPPEMILDEESRVRPCMMCGCPGPHEPEQCPHQCLRYVED